MDPDEDLLFAFRTFDVDGDGMISSEELRKVMDDLGAKLTEKELIDIYDFADEDKDGYLNFKEFCNLIIKRAHSTN